MSNELLGEWITYASFAIPGMMCFVSAVWDEWHDAQKNTSPARWS
jgi:hypothetical protein